MKKNLYLSLIAALAFAVTAVTVPSSVLASGSVPSGSVPAGSKARVNAQNSGSGPISKEQKGVKVFGIDTAATVVTDEAGTAAANGGLVSVEIAASTTGGTLPQCYVLVYDSSVAADTTEANSVSRLLVPPLPAALSQLARHEFSFPRQFNKGLVVLMGGANASLCRGSITWLTNGGAD